MQRGCLGYNVVMAINKDLINQLKNLSKTDRLTIMQILLDVDSKPEKRHKITELAGLGKEIWSNTDAQKYIDEERSDWN